ncbi:gamma-glutamylcyclotransferase [Paenibacillus sp. TRM 82003]|nr:gamma-glutamylcyclotransferase [Paenibacillus sp. TRM 82003]
MEHKVFVYGTLLRGESNNSLLRQARLCSEQAKVRGALLDTGDGYPALVLERFAAEQAVPESEAAADGAPFDRTNLGDWVYGELYAVDEATLAALDELEDYFGPGDARNLYDRERVKVTSDTEVQEAWTYTFGLGRTAGLRSIPLGDWRVDRRLRELSFGEGSLLYFAYASCMDDRRFLAQGAAAWFRDEAGRGSLAGYRLRFTCKRPDGGRADLLEEGGVAEGKLYRVGQNAIDYLWQREGVEAGAYRPVIVRVREAAGGAVEALTFFVREKEEETAPPPIYMEEILRGAKPVVSAAYYKELERLAEQWLPGWLESSDADDKEE